MFFYYFNYSQRSSIISKELNRKNFYKLNSYFLRLVMDVLYTSFLQKLVQSSNNIRVREDIQEKELLNLLTFLSLKVKESEAFMRDVSRRNIARHILAGLV